ncbi:putative neural-cadherin 2 [Schistocerca serialis cubense]|uniref:putative neural-cadherin 2 n=1 Tax=Schistocerca serialis cubense TaxID=2023355 RepID=UPI00214E9F55|nr:putative neural-cadherin 2 [Schistocerca serialis cubense]
MRFRTKETSGELIHIADHHSQEYAILEIRNSVLVFRYNLNSYYSEEIAICLCFIPVNDGYWHTVKASRYGSTAFLQIDDGENAQYNGTFSFRGHQLLVADKREGIYAGGKAEYTGMKTFEIQADFKNGCMDDIRLYGKSLPLPPVINATQWAQAVVAHNVVYGCTLNDSCAFVNCPEPLRCVEMSDSYECVCAEEVLKFGNNDCTDNNGCSQLPCWNGGMCISQDILSQYNCSCPDGTLGPNCESVLESQIFQLSPSALAAIITCFICIFALAVGFLVWSRRTRSLGKTKPENYDARKNGESCCDKLDSVENTAALDIKSLHGAIERKDKTTCIELQHVHLESIIIGRASTLEKCKKEADIDLIAHTAEDCKVYAYEGEVSAAPSISCPASVSCAESQTTGVCVNWGPQFATRIESEGHTDV